MKFRVDNNVSVGGTCLQGYVNTTYDALVAVFGEPCENDGYKTDAEWNIEFDDGEVATIYNYKDGKNYLGEDGLDVKNIMDWHIGGNNAKVVEYINDVVDDYKVYSITKFLVS